MANTFTAPFAQTPKTLTAVSTAACVIGSADAPTNTTIIATAGSNGALVTKIVSIPRATVTATAMYLFISKDNGTTQRLIDSELIGAYTLSATTNIAETSFSNITEATPIRLEVGDKLYIGAGVALAAGIVTRCEWSDF
jgi:hypothetical protein